MYVYVQIYIYIHIYIHIYIYIYEHQQLQLVKATESVSHSGVVKMAHGCACEGPANCLKLDD